MTVTAIHDATRATAVETREFYSPDSKAYTWKDIEDSVRDFFSANNGQHKSIILEISGPQAKKVLRFQGCSHSLEPSSEPVKLNYSYKSQESEKFFGTARELHLLFNVNQGSGSIYYIDYPYYSYPGIYKLWAEKLIQVIEEAMSGSVMISDKSFSTSRCRIKADEATLWEDLEIQLKELLKKENFRSQPIILKVFDQSTALSFIFRIETEPANPRRSEPLDRIFGKETLSAKVEVAQEPIELRFVYTSGSREPKNRIDVHEMTRFNNAGRVLNCSFTHVEGFHKKWPKRIMQVVETALGKQTDPRNSATLTGRAKRLV